MTSWPSSTPSLPLPSLPQMWRKTKIVRLLAEKPKKVSSCLGSPFHGSLSSSGGRNHVWLLSSFPSPRQTPRTVLTQVRQAVKVSAWGSWLGTWQIGAAVPLSYLACRWAVRTGHLKQVIVRRLRFTWLFVDLTSGRCQSPCTFWPVQDQWLVDLQAYVLLPLKN